MSKHPDTSPAARGERFAEALDSIAKMSGAELARRLNLENEQNITNWRRRGVPHSRIPEVAAALGVSPKWLGRGIGWPVEESTGQDVSANEVVTTYGSELPVITAGRVPVMGKAQLGFDGYFEVMDYPAGQGDGFLRVYSRDPEAYALKVCGNSMRPRIKDGEYVLIEPGKTPTPGDEVLVRTRGGRAMIKEFMYVREGTYRLDSVNENVSPVFVAEDEIVLIHFVAGQYKSHLYIPD